MSEILILMFHRVHEPRLGYCVEQFNRYLDYLCQHFELIKPMQTAVSSKPKCILTFDDAYFDFYYYVFPQLKLRNIPAVLAVSPYFIKEDSNVCANVRLSAPYPESMFDPKYNQHDPFCTWKELKTMQQSELVDIAAHGHEHKNLSDKNVNFEAEVIRPQAVLEAKLNTKIHGFIYPFGKCSRQRHRRVLQHYDYAMRIGSAVNRRWRSTLYRVDAEHFWPTSRPFHKKELRQWRRKYWLNRLRGK